MRLIEVLSLFKPGVRIRNNDENSVVGRMISSHEALVEFIAARSQEELMSDGWSILLPEGCFWVSHFKPESRGHQSRCVAVSVIVAAEHKKHPFRSEHLLNVMRRELDIPERHDVIVRELWLAMQLLTTPESCADFMRRSLVVS